MKRKETEMNMLSLHRQFAQDCAKQAGFMSTYWSQLGNGLSNDRTPEITVGSLEGWDD
jgi:hypothetical protein